MTRSYDSINMTNIRNSLHVVQTLVDTHRDDPVVVGMTPGMVFYTADFLISSEWYIYPLY
jgi:hypothetical protein